MLQFTDLLSGRCIVESLFALLSVAHFSQAWSKEVEPLHIGQAAPDFELPGVDGKTYRLSDFKDSNLLPVLFPCNHCPTAQAYEPRIPELYADYKDRGVRLAAISPNAVEAVRLDEPGYTDLGDSLDDMKLRAKQRGFEFPYL